LTSRETAGEAAGRVVGRVVWEKAVGERKAAPANAAKTSLVRILFPRAEGRNESAKTEEAEMTGESCPLPSGKESSDSGPIGRMLAARRIAVVGLSDDPMRPSYSIARYLMSVGKEVIPINPSHERALGLKCYPSLRDVPQPIDLVNVFRRPAACAQVVRDAIAIGAKGVWLQSGITNEEARQLAEEAGIDFVQNRCIMVEHRMKH
jgi:hypothetical protein